MEPFDSRLFRQGHYENHFRSLFHKVVYYSDLGALFMRDGISYALSEIYLSSEDVFHIDFDNVTILEEIMIIYKRMENNYAVTFQLFRFFEILTKETKLDNILP